MINEGKIKSINENEVVVVVTRKGSCGENCASCNSCNHKKVEVKAYSDIPVKIGDFVVIESDSKNVYLGLLILFIIPIVFPLLTYVFLYKLSEIAAGCLTVLALLASFVLIYFISKSKKFLAKITPVVKSVL